MSKGIAWRIGLILLFLVLSFVYLTPTLATKLPSWWAGILPRDRIHLGLDLQGGTHLVMEVETPKAVEGQLDIIATDLEDSLAGKNIRFKRIFKPAPDRVAVTLYDRASAEGALKVFKEKYPRLQIQSPVDEGG